MKVVVSLYSLFSNFRTTSLSFPLSFFPSLSEEEEGRKKKKSVINE